MDPDPTLTPEERAVHEWQMWVPGFGEEGQERLKGSSVLISRVGGLGGLVAYELAAAGVGRLVLAHAGKVKPSDLNRQLLMTHDWIGKSRVERAGQRLRDLNPRIEIETVPENVSDDNADRLVAGVDLVVDAAPLFEERYAMNDAAVRHSKPQVECAMYDMETQITSFKPGVTGCLRCLYPEKPPYWKRQFPVFGAVSGSVACLGATEAIKMLTELGEPLYKRLLCCDLRTMRFRTMRIGADPDCPVCGKGGEGGQE